jgi:hypothetical protein
MMTLPRTEPDPVSQSRANRRRLEVHAERAALGRGAVSMVADVWGRAPRSGRHGWPAGLRAHGVDRRGRRHGSRPPRVANDGDAPSPWTVRLLAPRRRHHVGGESGLARRERDRRGRHAAPRRRRAAVAPSRGSVLVRALQRHADPAPRRGHAPGLSWRGLGEDRRADGGVPRRLRRNRGERDPVRSLSVQRLRAPANGLATVYQPEEYAERRRGRRAEHPGVSPAHVRVRGRPARAR